MKQVSQDYRRYYLSEFALYDGDHFVNFNIVDISAVKNKITVAVSNEGRINICSFDLKSDGEHLFFEYGVSYQKISLDDFEEVRGNE